MTIITILVAITGVDVLTFSTPEVVAYGDIAAATVSATLASAGAYVTDTTGDGGYIYSLDNREIVVYFA